MRPPDLQQAIRKTKDGGLLYPRSCARTLAAEVERLEVELAAAEQVTRKMETVGKALKQRAESAEARVARLTEMLLAYDAERALYLRRLLWLHDCSTGTTGADGYEWGIYRVKWVNGQPAEVWQTNSDFSDLDEAIERDEYKLPASAKALEARVAELEAQYARLREALEVELAENQTLQFGTPLGAFELFATKQRWRIKAALADGKAAPCNEHVRELLNLPEGTEIKSVPIEHQSPSLPLKGGRLPFPPSTKEAAP